MDAEAAFVMENLIGGSGAESGTVTLTSTGFVPANLFGSPSTLTARIDTDGAEYVQLVAPANPDGTPKMDPHCLHIWPRRWFMLMGLANQDGGFTGTLFMPHHATAQSPGFDTVQGEQAVRRFFAEQFPGIDDSGLAVERVVRLAAWVDARADDRLRTGAPKLDDHLLRHSLLEHHNPIILLNLLPIPIKQPKIVLDHVLRAGLPDLHHLLDGLRRSLLLVHLQLQRLIHLSFPFCAVAVVEELVVSVGSEVGIE